MGTFTLDEDTGNTTPNQHPTGDDDLPTPPPPPPGSKTWVLDATSVLSLEQQEPNSIVNPADELYLARIKFRSTMSKERSTSAYFNGGISSDTVIKNVHRAETHSIPDAMGRVVFPNVVQRSVVDLIRGINPEILGTLDVLFTDDNTPKDRISDLMRELALAVKDELALIVEDLSLLEPDAECLATEMRAATLAIQAAVMPTVGEAIGLFLASWLNPDDLVGFKINLFIAVDESLAAVVDAQLAGAISTSAGVASALRERSYSQVFNVPEGDDPDGGEGSWRVSYSVSS